MLTSLALILNRIQVELRQPACPPETQLCCQTTPVANFSGRNPLRSKRLKFLLGGSQVRFGVSGGLSGRFALSLGEPSPVGGQVAGAPDSQAGHMLVTTAGLQNSGHKLLEDRRQESHGF